MDKIDQSHNTGASSISIASSPCIDICEVNDENNCNGCYRSIDEITGWNALSNNKKVAILEQVDIRKKSLSHT